MWCERYVTFPEQHLSSTALKVFREDPGLPNTFRVIVPVRPGQSEIEIQWDAMRIARYRKEQKSWNDLDSKELKIEHIPYTLAEIAPFIDELLSRMQAMAGVGIRLEVSQGAKTASTDCRSIVMFNPEPFIEGKIEAGFGRGLHEVGHILFDRNGTILDPKRSPVDEAYGTLLLERAHDEGGERLQSILNLIMDRRSDDLQMKMYPGNVDALRYRIPHLLPGERHNPETNNIEKRLNGCLFDCDRSVFVDFLYAIKKRTRPKHAIVHKCVSLARRAIWRVNEGKRPYAHLLTTAIEIVRRLSESDPEHATPKQEPQRLDLIFWKVMRAFKRAEQGRKVSKAFAEAFREHLGLKLKVRRIQALATIKSALSSVSSGAKNKGGSGSVDPSKEKVIFVPLNPEAYRSAPLKAFSAGRRMRQLLQLFSVPVTNVLQGLNQGEFDLEALPAFMIGQSDVMKIEFKRTELDLAIALLLDVSGSMDGLDANHIAVAWNEGLRDSEREVSSRLFAFNDVVYDCGKAQRNNGIVGIDCCHGTNETFGVRVAGNWLATEKRRFRILLTICDGAPADSVSVRKEAHALLRQGILPVRILVGVDIAPKTYPVELFFNGWDEFQRELYPLFKTLIQSARA